MDQSDIVNLRWNQHQTTLVSVFDDLLDKEKLTDCTISAEGQHLRAHKIILCACSPYFEELFTENNEKDPIIILHDIKYDTIKALKDFMYRGEVNVLQTDLKDVFNLSESLQVRGLSSSGYADNVSKQNISGINSPPPGLEDLLSQPASVSCFTRGQNDPEEKVQSFRVCSPTMSSQEGLSVGVDLLPKSIQKYGKGVNDSGSRETTDEHACEEFITPDCDSVHQLQSQRQVLPTMCNLASGSVYNPNHVKSVCSELEATKRKMAVAENRQCLKSRLRNLQSFSEDLPSQGISRPMPCFTEGQNNSEENMQSFRQWYPTVSPQEGDHLEVDSISKSIRKYRKSMNQYGYDKGRGQNTLEEVITSDLDSIHQLPSQRQVLSTTCVLSDGPVYRASGQVTVAENEQFSMPEAVLTDGSSATLKYQQHEVTVETKSELNENNMEIVEDLTLDVDDDFSSSGDYNRVKIDNREANNPNLGLTNEKTVHIQGSKNQHSPLGKDYLNNMTLTASQSVLHNQFRCDSCGKSYRYLKGLQRHVKYQCGKERRRFQCPHCSNHFARNDLLQKHVKYQCGKEQRFQCSHCSKRFARRDVFQRHMKYHCGKEPQFKCPHCHFQYTRSDRLKVHIAKHH